MSAGACATPAQEMRQIVEMAFRLYGALTWKQRVHQTSVALRITPRRVQAILYGEVHRVWADEIEHTRRWNAAVHADFAARAAELGRRLL